MSSDVIFNGRAGTALNALTIYSDSTFTQPTRYSFTAGQLLDIIGETELEHEDDAQNQTFKWYKVRMEGGREGWVFGDGLAVVIPEDQLSQSTEAYHKRKMKFGIGFESAVVWMAAIEGHDNFHANMLLNPIYQEAYIVITNHRGKSVHIHYGGESTQGLSGVEEMQFQELTGDLIPELVLLRKNEVLGQKKEQKSLELYSFQAGTIKKVFEERLNLETEGKEQFPSLHFVTYTYHWNSQSKQYQLLYQENRSAPQVQVKITGVVLQEAPSETAPRIRSIRPDESLAVIRQHDDWKSTGNGYQSKESYFYVRVKEGRYGYIPVRYCHFVHTALAQQLDDFYQQPSAPTKTVSCFSIRGTHADSSAYNH